MEDDIKQLSVGQALVVGECVEQPITVKIRARESKHYGTADHNTEQKEITDEKKKKLIDKIKPIFVEEDDEPAVFKPKKKKKVKEQKKEKPVKMRKRDILKSLFLKPE